MADQKRYLDLDGLTAFWGKIKEKMAPIDDSRFITDSERSKLSLIADGAEVNQNAFAKITVGSTTITADAKQDTLTVVAGSGISLTPDATNDKLTIAVSGAGSMSGGTVADSTLSGTITNSGTISGGTISGSTLSGTITGASGSTIDLDGSSSVLVPTATKGDNTTKAASTAFVKTAVDTAVSTINSTTSDLNTRLTTAESAITTLNGTGDGSVKKQVADAIAGVVASAPEDFDTLKEVADWIASDTTKATEMSNAISALQANDGKVTSVDNHYTPAENTSSAITASGGSAKNITNASAGQLNVVTGLKRDAKGHVVGVTCSNIYSTDASTTLSGHYTPAENTNSALSASGASATDITNGSGVQVVTGLKRDAKGHVVGVVSACLKSTNTNTTYSAGTGLSLSSNTFSLKTAGVQGAEGATIGGVMVAKDNSSYSVVTNTSSISANVTSAGKYYGVELDSNDKAFVYVPWTDTNTKVTAVGNHYAPAEDTSVALSASGATATDITNGSGVQVVTGLKRDAKGHVVGVVSACLKSTNTNDNTTYTASTGLSLSGTAFSLKTAATGTIGGIKIRKDTTGYAVTAATSGTISADVTSGKYYGVEIDKNDAAFVYVPWTDTNTKVTSVDNHYAPAEDTAVQIDAASGDASNITGTSGKLNVVVGLKRDAKGHVVGVISKNIYSTDNNNTYTASTGLSLSSGAFSLKTAATGSIGGIKIHKDTTGYAVTPNTSGTISADTSGGKYYAVEIDKNDAAFVYVPWTDTNTAVTHVDNHYTPAENTSSQLNASGGSAKDITNNSSTGQLNVVTGIKRDAKGHVVGVVCSNIYSKNTTYSTATTQANGLMSRADKTNLDNCVTICAEAPTSRITEDDIDTICV